jgi:hypothetical protein
MALPILLVLRLVGGEVRRGLSCMESLRAAGFAEVDLRHREGVVIFPSRWMGIFLRRHFNFFSRVMIESFG